jgi:hypothetical protein
MPEEKQEARVKLPGTPTTEKAILVCGAFVT